MPDRTTDPSSGLPAQIAEPSGVEQPVLLSQTVTQEEIDDLINDTTMPIEERQARLEAIAHQSGLHSAVDEGGSLDPLEMQIAEALGLLAEGGHAYGTPESEPHDSADLDKL